MTTEIAAQRTAPATLPKTIGELLRLPDLGARLAAIAPPGFDGKRLARELAATLRENPPLRSVTVDSLLIAVSRIASLALSLAPAQAECFLIPRRDRKESVSKATLMIGRNGWLALAIRTGRVADAWAHAVHERDKFKLKLGNGFHVEHEPALAGDRGALVGVYAIGQFANGNTRGVYLNRDDVLAVKALADPDSLAWQRFESTMWEKCALKRLCRLLAAGHPVLTAAIAVDDQVQTIDLPVIELEPPALDHAAGPSYAEIRDRIDKCTAPDELDIALSMLGHLPADQQTELKKLITDRRTALLTSSSA